MTTDVAPAIDLQDLRTFTAKWAIDCGRRVADRRKDLTWDRRQLAGLVGTTEATITRIEQGAINPRDHMKLAIAAMLLTEVELLWPYPRRADVSALASQAA